MYKLDDKVQAYDGRIGIVTEAELINCGSRLSEYQHILVCFPDQSTMNGSAEKFKAVEYQKNFAVLTQKRSNDCAKHGGDRFTN